MAKDTADLVEVGNCKAGLNQCMLWKALYK